MIELSRGFVPRCWEGQRVISRSRLAMMMVGMGLALSTLGCSDAFNAGPLEYVESEALTKDIPGKANLAGKPTLQAKVRQGLISLFGENPQRIKVPEGAPLLAGGIYLANYRPGRRGRGRPDQANLSSPTRRFPRFLASSGGGLRDLPPELPPLPRRIRCRRRTDRPVLVSSAPRLSQGDLQVHLHHPHRRSPAPG